MYFQEWFDEKKGNCKNPKVLSYFWPNKNFCSKKCLKEYRAKQFKICKHCGKKFYRPPDISTSGWMGRTMCSRDCSLEYGYITNLAPRLGITYEQLKKELLLISEKYNDA